MARAQRLQRAPLQPVASFPGDDLIPANRLTGRQRSELWAHIQQHEPGMQSFLKDPVVSMLIKESGGVVLFQPSLVESALGHDARIALMNS
jgi:hypothetical protein